MTGPLHGLVQVSRCAADFLLADSSYPITIVFAIP
jgi:hypothetical protein